MNVDQGDDGMHDIGTRPGIIGCHDDESHDDLNEENEGDVPSPHDTNGLLVVMILGMAIEFKGQQIVVALSVESAVGSGDIAGIQAAASGEGEEWWCWCWCGCGWCWWMFDSAVGSSRWRRRGVCRSCSWISVAAVEKCGGHFWMMVLCSCCGCGCCHGCGVIMIRMMDSCRSAGVRWSWSGCRARTERRERQTCCLNCGSRSRWWWFHGWIVIMMVVMIVLYLMSGSTVDSSSRGWWWCWSGRGIGSGK